MFEVKVALEIIFALITTIPKYYKASVELSIQVSSSELMRAQSRTRGFFFGPMLDLEAYWGATEMT